MEEKKNEYPVFSFEKDDETYEVRYNIGAVKKFEQKNGPILPFIARNGGNMTIEGLEILLAHGLEKNGVHVPFAEARKLAEGVIMENGYEPAFQVVANSLQRDCGFLFKRAA